MATRLESMAVAERLVPNGFKFNSLELVDGRNDAECSGVWIATYIDESTPPQIVIERWPDYYTEGDPEPEEREDNASESEAEAATSN